MAHRVYVTRALPDEVLAPLRDTCRLEVWGGEGPVPAEVLFEGVADAEGLLCMLTDAIDRELLESAPNLRVVSQMAVGVDNIDVVECSRRGIAVGHTPGVLTETVADTAFALLGAIVRRLPEGEREVREGRWGPWSPFHLTGGDLHGSRMGIVGMGRIGRAVARRAAGFDMEVLYTSPNTSGVEGATASELSRLLATADHVVICAALNPETKGLIGARELDSMPTSSYLVNVARGPIVDPDALLDALAGGSIAGAALDVTDPEPLPPDHPLLALSNCLVVPHIASASARTRLAMAELAVENLLAALAGLPMPARHPGS